MKTTIDIAGKILLRAKQVARKERTTLRELTEEGLELVLLRHENRPTTRAKPVVFNGRGLSPDFAGASWERVRNAAYEGHGS